MPFSTRRSSTRGTPRGLLGRSGAITRHSKSVRSYRLMHMLNQISHATPIPFMGLRPSFKRNRPHPGAHLERAFSEETEGRLGLAIEYRPTRTRDELRSFLPPMVAAPPQAISLLADGFAIQNRQTIIDFAMRLRVPVISGWPVFARSGAICTYGPYRIVPEVGILYRPHSQGREARRASDG